MSNALSCDCDAQRYNPLHPHRNSELPCVMTMSRLSVQVLQSWGPALTPTNSLLSGLHEAPQLFFSHCSSHGVSELVCTDAAWEAAVLHDNKQTHDGNGPSVREQAAAISRHRTPFTSFPSIHWTYFTGHSLLDIVYATSLTTGFMSLKLSESCKISRKAISFFFMEKKSRKRFMNSWCVFKIMVLK